MHILQHQLAQLKHSGEVRVHLMLEFLDLLLRHLVLRVVKDLLTEHLQYVEIVLADAHVLGGGLTDVVDEGPPAGVPLVFDDLDED